MNYFFVNQPIDGIFECIQGLGEFLCLPLKVESSYGDRDISFGQLII